MGKKTLVICYLVIALIFIYSGVIKIIDPLNFSKNIAAFEILPHETINFFALLIPMLEIVFGIAIFFPSYSKASLVMLGSLTVIFTIALFSAWISNKEIDCGCFGGETKVSLFKIIMDIVLFLIIIFSLWVHSKNYNKTEIFKDK